MQPVTTKLLVNYRRLSGWMPSPFTKLWNAKSSPRQGNKTQPPPPKKKKLNTELSISRDWAQSYCRTAQLLEFWGRIVQNCLKHSRWDFLVLAFHTCTPILQGQQFLADTGAIIIYFHSHWSLIETQITLEHLGTALLTDPPLPSLPQLPLLFIKNFQHKKHIFKRPNM